MNYIRWVNYYRAKRPTDQSDYYFLIYDVIEKIAMDLWIFDVMIAFAFAFSIFCRQGATTDGGERDQQGYSLLH